MSSPVKIWSVTKTGYDEFFPENIEMVWLGDEKLLVMSREEGWQLLDIKNRTTAEVVAEDSLPPLIEPGEPIGETSIVPNETSRTTINAFIRGQELPPQLPPGSHISRALVSPAPLGTLLVDVLPLSLAVASWGLAWHVESLRRYQTTPPEYYLHSPEAISYPTVWNVAIEEEQAGVFLSHLQPYIALDSKINLWYIFVQRHDCGIDVYRLNR